MQVIAARSCAKRTSSVAMKAASPMVKLGKMMWKDDGEGELETGQQNGI